MQIDKIKLTTNGACGIPLGLVFTSGADMAIARSLVGDPAPIKILPLKKKETRLFLSNHIHHLIFLSFNSSYIVRMSRLLIKNLPVNASNDSLRTHLSSVKHLSPVITDVHVARKADGTPRRFAFVGFKSEEQAAAIEKYFDKTYWGSQKIAVEIVQVGHVHP